MEQTYINWLLGCFGGLTGFLLNSVWQAVKDLQKADRDLATKVAEIEVLVAGDYLKRDEFSETIKTMFTKLDRIEDKLNLKADRENK